MMEAVEDFYGKYYFRPRRRPYCQEGYFRFQERRRLYKEAREYLSLRAKRKQFVANQRA